MEQQIAEMVGKLGIEVALPILLRELEKFGGRDAVLVAYDALLARFREEMDADVAKKHDTDPG